MSKVYKKVELVGSSSESLEDAVKVALARARRTLRNLDWLEVKEIRGSLTDGYVIPFPLESITAMRSQR